jgi:hypothetical protein
VHAAVTVVQQMPTHGNVREGGSGEE